MSNDESVGAKEALFNIVLADVLAEPGDARAAWEAVLSCVQEDKPFPDWVTRYLGETAAALLEHLPNRDKDHPSRLVRALGFDRLNVREADTYDRDPEVVYERISTWLANGEVKDKTAGAKRYHEEVLGKHGSPETVRELFYRGQKLHPMASRPEKRPKPRA